jgi:hypothetical protein
MKRAYNCNTYTSISKTKSWLYHRNDDLDPYFVLPNLY